MSRVAVTAIVGWAMVYEHALLREYAHARQSELASGCR